MKRAVLTVVVALYPLFAVAAPGVRFDTVVSEAGKPIAHPSVWVPFGKDAVVEVAGKVRIVASAKAPFAGRSLVKAKVYRFAAGKWVQDWNGSMSADIGKTPSFELNMKDKSNRVVIMPRAAESPSNGS